jgi:hypothetical protein
MTTVERFESEINERADGEYPLFLTLFLQRSGQPECGVAGALKCVRELRISTMPKLRRFAGEIRDAKLAQAVEQYCGCLQEAGYSPDGSGGCRNFQWMTGWQLSDFCRRLEEAAGKLGPLVNEARKRMIPPWRRPLCFDRAFFRSG